MTERPFSDLQPRIPIVICDIDGTISNCHHRQHLAAQKDWDAFHDLMSEDGCFPHVKRTALQNACTEERPPQWGWALVTCGASVSA